MNFNNGEREIILTARDYMHKIGQFTIIIYGKYLSEWIYLWEIVSIYINEDRMIEIN